MLSAMDVHESSPAAIAARVKDVIGAGAVYLSFDIDALDPAFAPGTTIANEHKRKGDCKNRGMIYQSYKRGAIGMTHPFAVW